MSSIQIFRSSIATPIAFVFLQLTVVSVVSAQTDDTTARFLNDFESMQGNGEQVLLALPERPGAWEVSRPSTTPILLETVESTDRRTHVVKLDGKVYRASTPLEGSRSHIAFDPIRKRFKGLLSSIRVEVSTNIDAMVLAETVDAKRITTFQKLGFHILELPEDVHPGDAVKAIQRLAGQPKATVRTRSMKLEWR